MYAGSWRNFGVEAHRFVRESGRREHDRLLKNPASRQQLIDETAQNAAQQQPVGDGPAEACPRREGRICMNRVVIPAQPGELVKIRLAEAAHDCGLAK